MRIIRVTHDPAAEARWDFLRRFRVSGDDDLVWLDPVDFDATGNMQTDVVIEDGHIDLSEIERELDLLNDVRSYKRIS